MTSSSVNFVLFQLNALNTVYGNKQHVTKVTMKMPGEANTIKTESEPVSGAAQVALKGLCSYYTACFSLNREMFKQTLADGVEFTFVRMKGDFQQGEPKVIKGVAEVYDFCSRFLFDITSNFKIRKMEASFNGQNATVDIDVEEDKIIDGKTVRCHMHCHDFIVFDKDGMILTFMERNSRDPLKV